MIPVGAKENLQGEGLIHPDLQEGNIMFEEVLEEVAEEHADAALEDEKGLYLWDSKLKGWFREDNITPNNFLGMIRDGDGHISIKGSSRPSGSERVHRSLFSFTTPISAPQCQHFIIKSGYRPFFGVTNLIFVSNDTSITLFVE